MVHHLLDGQITFVAYEQFVDVLARVTLNLLQPLLDVVEGLLVRAIVHYDDAVCAPVVRRGDRTEPLLASRVPLKGEGGRGDEEGKSYHGAGVHIESLYTYDLQLYRFVIQRNCPNFLQTERERERERGRENR